MNVSEHVFLHDRCLAVYVDDTGHEGLAPGHPVYGLGGCAVMGRDLGSVIVQPWREIRRQITGSPDLPLHASSFSTFAKGSDIEAVATFFRCHSFHRFGAILSTDTKLADEMGAIRTIKEVLQTRISNIVQRILCREVKVIFESSERANSLIERAFQDFELRRGRKHIPSECYFMPKSSADPALEVADFVMHAIGRQARQNLKHRGIILPDFHAVFHSINPSLVSFMEIQSVAIT